MSVSLVFGLPRSGKSTFLVWCARRALQKKPLTLGFGLWKSELGQFAPYDRVYCNFPCPGTYELKFDDLGVQQFENCLIIIDEIMLLCDSRDWKNYSAHLRDFMALHGHYKVDIIAASQCYSDCDVRIRNLAERLLFVERKGNHSRISPIVKGWAVDTKITESYKLAPPIACRYLNRKPLYKFFDSFAAPRLLENTAALWSLYEPPLTIRQKISRLFRWHLLHKPD